MRNYGRTSIAELVGDLIVYRNLNPADPRLADLRPHAGLPDGATPRKSEPAYANVIVACLSSARELDSPGTPIERLVYLGDTRMNDGIAFANIARAGRWAGMAFIAAETDAPLQIEVRREDDRTLVFANRWQALSDFEDVCRRHDFPLDERTAVVVDLDKTALGARGRNDHTIDRVRVEAVRRTVSDLLGGEFDPARFQTAYDYLNRPEFHPFTADNQDYLATICLILGSGLFELETLVAEVRCGRMAGFAQFMAEVEGRAGELPPNLRAVHGEIYGHVLRGDPTPFKAFRHQEYRATVERMGWLGDDEPVGRLLAEEIVVTDEVRQVALRWRGQGAMLFALSDKPDEASIPTADLAAQGYRPIHRAVTHAVGV